jgi:two-component system, sensor histidine kinase and response regulator
MTSPNSEKHRVLCIEDDLVIRTSILTYLEDEGYEVFGAADGAEGLQQFRTLHPQVVLSDIRMPKMDGLAVLKTIKAESPGTEVIVISGTGSDEDLVNCINNGAFRYFRKPANLIEIAAEVKSALELTDLRLKDKKQKEYLEELITDRTLQLRVSQERYQAVFDSLNIVYICDFNWNFIDANEAALDVMGYAKEEIIGLNILDVLHPGQPLEPVERVFNELTELGHQKLTLEVKLTTKDKQTVYIESKSAVSPESGEIIGVAKDVTRRKIAEEELQKSYEDLEKRVEERTAELAQINQELQAEIFERKQIEEKLILAKKQAENANMIKSQFLANVSHELRTPMHGILSFSKFGIDWIDSADKEKQLHYFKQIHSSGERLLNMLNDLLDLSKLESGKMEYEMAERDIRMIVNGNITEFSLTAEENKVRLHVDEPEFSTRIVCDETRIDQVIRNLLSNAIKFTPASGNITISFQTTSLPLGRRSTDQKNVETLVVSVSDEGIGIPDKELGSIFDKFVQSSKTKTDISGTGLGLAICSEIIRAHHGEIWAQNNPKVGATFTFTLPFLQPF